MQRDLTMLVRRHAPQIHLFIGRQRERAEQDHGRHVRADLLLDLLDQLQGTDILDFAVNHDSVKILLLRDSESFARASGTPINSRSGAASIPAIVPQYASVRTDHQQLLHARSGRNARSRRKPRPANRW